jgi:hypothetical protein
LKALVEGLVNHFGPSMVKKLDRGM